PVRRWSCRLTLDHVGKPVRRRAVFGLRPVHLDRRPARIAADTGRTGAWTTPGSRRPGGWSRRLNPHGSIGADDNPPRAARVALSGRSHRPQTPPRAGVVHAAGGPVVARIPGVAG